MNRKILKAGDLAKLTSYHPKSICRLARQGKIDGNRANPGGKQIWWKDDKKIWRWINSHLKDDSKDAPVPHPLTFVNYFEKWDRQVRTRQIQGLPIETLRHDLERPLFRMVELVGRKWFLKRANGYWASDAT